MTMVDVADMPRGEVRRKPYKTIEQLRRTPKLNAT